MTTSASLAEATASTTSVAGLLDASPPAGFDLPCQTEDPDLWFAESPHDLETAKRLCMGCPLRTECLQGALARGEPWGVWGGEIFDAGTIVAAKRPRGRPRKETA
jgi:WhiB family redox-sensing transcriptional regulator